MKLNKNLYQGSENYNENNENYVKSKILSFKCNGKDLGG